MLFYEKNEQNKMLLKKAYKYILARIFPDKYEGEFSSQEISDIHGVLTEIRNVEMQKVSSDADDADNFIMLQENDISDSGIKDEYIRFKDFWDKNFISEMMIIGREITPFNTFGHVCGVHHVAMHVARQMKLSGFPVDLALVSAAALAHDLGKYGCTGNEMDHVPYLHYYYTSELLTRNDMPLIARIAGNHSVWDLERERLSAEWMILIYADFRVKSYRDEIGREMVKFSSLEDAFHVILSKLDNLDENKAARYKRAYARLKKFEDYMVYLGVDPELNGQWRKAEYTLQKAAPFMMLDYQLRIASKFNYLSQSKMEEMLKLLAGKFPEQTDELRGQTVMIMREIIDNYDWINNKVLPEGVELPEPEMTAAELRERYKEILSHG